MKRSASSDGLGGNGEKVKKPRSEDLVIKEAELAGKEAELISKTLRVLALREELKTKLKELSDREAGLTSKEAEILATLEAKVTELEEKSKQRCSGCENLARIADDRDRMMGQAISVARRYGMEKGERTKMWVINEMVRALFQDNEEVYKSWAAKDEGWDVGIPPLKVCMQELENQE
jgi:hypothetical protein